jgi:hypothetical protein
MRKSVKTVLILYNSMIVFRAIFTKGGIEIILKTVSNDKSLVYILGFAGLISAADNWIVSPILPAIAA